MDALLGQLSQSVTRARSVEELARPLLELLEGLTGFDSTYLTTIDLKRGVQRVLYARNTRQMQVTEGLCLPWSDSLCKRALDEGRLFADDVEQRWGDSQAGATLGIHTYAGMPVRLTDGQLYGTLCAASSDTRNLSPRARHALALFARLIADQVEREQLVEQLLRANAQLEAFASTDALTGLPNRRALQAMLQQQLAQGARQGTTVLVAFVDLDGFKAVNDTYGHEAGDQFLTDMAERLRHALRTQDFVARYGGDEFVVLGPGPAEGPDAETARQAFTERIAQATRGRFGRADFSLDYAGASVGSIAVRPGTLTASEALHEADHAMYVTKQARKRSAQG